MESTARLLTIDRASFTIRQLTFDRFPALQLIIGHMGVGLPYALARSNGILSGPAQLRQTVAEYFRTNIHVTTSGLFSRSHRSSARWRWWGSIGCLVSVDYPFSANARGRTFLQDAARWLTEAEMKKLTGGDAASVLQLSLVDGTRLTRRGVPA
jgi:predicted TIM-barrel fold metal-dependent hydrolase